MRLLKCVLGARVKSVAPLEMIGHSGVAIPKALARMRGRAKGARVESVAPHAMNWPH